MPRADGTTGTLPGSCSCGCGSVTVGDSTAHSSCGCGCGSSVEAAPKTPAEEAADLRAMREAIDRRLEELAG